MYERVLVAVDPGGVANDAVRVVAALFRGTGAQVLVLGVRRSDTPVAATDEVARALRVAATTLVDAGINARSQVRDSHENEVADVIAKAAGDVEADLLALGSHGRSALGGLLLGSVGRAVAQSVDCALLLARRSETPDAGTPVVQRILLAVDASSQSRVAVDAAADLASVSRAEVVAIHVLESREAAVGSPASAERLVGEAVRRLRERGVEATGSVLAGTGGVAGRIAGAADSQGADVVVIGSRRRPGPGHVMWGSTAGGLMHLTRHPILLAESPERRRLGRAGAGR